MISLFGDNELTRIVGIPVLDALRTEFVALVTSNGFVFSGRTPFLPSELFDPEIPAETYLRLGEGLDERMHIWKSRINILAPGFADVMTQFDRGTFFRYDYLSQTLKSRLVSFRCSDAEINTPDGNELIDLGKLISRKLDEIDVSKTWAALPRLSSKETNTAPVAIFLIMSILLIRWMRTL